MQSDITNISKELISSIPVILNSKISHLTEDEIQKIKDVWVKKLDSDDHEYDIDAEQKLENILEIIKALPLNSNELIGGHEYSDGRHHKRNYQYLILYLKGELKPNELGGGTLEAGMDFFSFQNFPTRGNFSPSPQLNGDPSNQKLWILNYFFSGRAFNPSLPDCQIIQRIKNKSRIYSSQTDSQHKSSRISEVDLQRFKDTCPPLTEFVDSHGIYKISNFHLEALEKILTTPKGILNLEAEIEIAKQQSPSKYYSDILEKAIFATIVMLNDKLPTPLFTSDFFMKHFRDEKQNFIELVNASIDKERLEVFNEHDLRSFIGLLEKNSKKIVFNKLIQQGNLDKFLDMLLSENDLNEQRSNVEEILLGICLDDANLRSEFIKNKKFKTFIFKILSDKSIKDEPRDRLYRELSVKDKARYHQYLILEANSSSSYPVRRNQGRVEEFLTEIPDFLVKFMQISEQEKSRWQETRPRIKDQIISKQTSLDSKNLRGEKHQFFARLNSSGDFIMGLVDDRKILYSGLKITADGRIQVGRFDEKGNLILDYADQQKLFASENLSADKIKVLNRATLLELENGIKFHDDTKQKPKDLLDKTTDNISELFGPLLNMKPDELKTKVAEFVEKQLGIELSNPNLVIITLEKINDKWLCTKKIGGRQDGSVIYGHSSEIEKGQVQKDILGNTILKSADSILPEFAFLGPNKLDSLPIYLPPLSSEISFESATAGAGDLEQETLPLRSPTPRIDLTDDLPTQVASPQLISSAESLGSDQLRSESSGSFNGVAEGQLPDQGGARSSEESYRENLDLFSDARPPSPSPVAFNERNQERFSCIPLRSLYARAKTALRQRFAGSNR